MRKYIGITRYGEFLRKYYKQLDEGTNIRLGQAFCNEFDITDPELFYEENYSYAVTRITSYIVEDEDEVLD